jgi:hypothetical protein
VEKYGPEPVSMINSSSSDDDVSTSGASDDESAVERARRRLAEVGAGFDYYYYYYYLLFCLSFLSLCFFVSLSICTLSYANIIWYLLLMYNNIFETHIYIYKNKRPESVWREVDLPVQQRWSNAGQRSV